MKKDELILMLQIFGGATLILGSFLGYMYLIVYVIQP